MNKIRSRIASLVLGDRIYAWILFGAVTAFFDFGLKDKKLESIFSDPFPKDDPFIHVFENNHKFGNPLTYTVMVKNKNGDIYNQEILEKAWILRRDIDFTPGVNHIQIISISSSKERCAQATRFGIDAQSHLGCSVPTNAEEIEMLKDNVRKSQNTRALLISDDESVTLIKATFIEYFLDYGMDFKYIQKMAMEARDAGHELIDHFCHAECLQRWG